MQPRAVFAVLQGDDRPDELLMSDVSHAHLDVVAQGLQHQHAGEHGALGANQAQVSHRGRQPRRGQDGHAARGVDGASKVREATGARFVGEQQQRH